jgi:hypothetical protein
MTVFILCLAIGLFALTAGGLALRFAARRVDAILAEELPASPAPASRMTMDLVEHR